MGLILAVAFPAAASAASYELNEAHPSFCSLGSAAGQCETGIKGVAVDQSNGNVYLADPNNGRIDAFDSSGNFLWAAGWKVLLGSSSETFQVCTTGTGCQKGTSTGAGLGKVGSGARSLAVDPSTHIVYVNVNPSVKYFDGGTGAFLGEFNSNSGFNAAGTSMPPSPTAPNAFSAVTGIAVDASTAQHYLYLAATATLIDKFKVPVVTAGTLITQASYLCQITGLETPSATECHVTASKDGVFNGLSFTAKKGGDLAVDSSGNNVILAEEAARKTVSVFDSTGTFVKQFKPKTGATEVPAEAVAAGASGHVFVAVESKAANEGGMHVQEYDLASPTAAISDFGLGTIGTASPTSPGSLGVAVDLSGLASNGRVYVSDSSTNAKVWNFEVAVPGPPRIKEQESTNVTPVTAEVKAKVHAGNANVTDCHFEYVTQAAFETTAFTDLSSGGSKPCVETVANDQQYHPVHADLDSLTPSTQYRWRTVATNAVPATTKGTAETFTTGAAGAPTVDATSLGTLSPTTAEVKATINPHFSEVNAANSHFSGRKDCRFEYTPDPEFHDEIKAKPCETPPNLGKGGAGVPTKSILTGLTPNTTYYWRVYAANAIGSVESAPPLSFTTWVKPATGITDPVGAVGETTAVLNGRVDNHDAPLGSICEFQVALKADTAFSSPVKTLACTPNPVTGSGNVAVSATATGLTKNTEYIYRVRAKNQGNEQAGTGFANGAPVSFTTSEAPTIVQGVISVGETKATLGAFINPNGLATTYHLEYVDDATFQADQPEGFEHAIKTTESSSIGSDHTSHEVSVQIEELTKETTYHYRFVAHNANGTTKAPPRLFVTSGPIESNCANETLREENASEALPECRAYEMVTPPDKNFGTADEATGPRAIVAWDGEGLAFCTSAQFGDPAPENGGICNANYISRRTVGGWRTRGMVPNYCPKEFNDPQPQEGLVAAQAFPSPNLDFAAISRPETASCTVYPALAAHSTEPGAYLYREDLLSDPTAYALLTPEPAFPSAYRKQTGAYAAASDDFSRIVYESTGNQLNDPATPAGINRLFEWHDGTLSLISREPVSNAAFATPSEIPFAPAAGPGAANAANAVSADGGRIFFLNGSGTGQEIYLREGATTYWVSQQECSPAACPDTSAADKFNGATLSGSKALFRSAAKLTNEDTSTSGEDLYMFTKGPNPAGEQNLTLLSKDNEPADGTKAEVQGVIGLSDDGNTVYFVAKGQIVPGQPTAAEANVYRWRWNGGSPSVEYLTTLKTAGAGNSEDGQNWSASENSGERIGMPVSLQVTPDGTVLLIQTVKPLDPFLDRDSARDVYRWSGQEGWTCLSCQAPAIASAGESTIDINTAEHLPEKVMTRMSNELNHPMSDDGSRIFFGTWDALVPADENGLEDVYQWQNGNISLISTGTGVKPSALIGASRSGHDVFFVTARPLLGSDTDEATDFYDARIGGGFTPPPPEPICHTAEECHGEGTRAPAPSPAGTASHQGAGDPPVARCKKGFVRKHGKCVPKNKKHHKPQAKRASHNRRAAK